MVRITELIYICGNSNEKFVGYICRCWTVYTKFWRMVALSGLLPIGCIIWHMSFEVENESAGRDEWSGASILGIYDSTPQNTGYECWYLNYITRSRLIIYRAAEHFRATSGWDSNDKKGRLGSCRLRRVMRTLVEFGAIFPVISLITFSVCNRMQCSFGCGMQF
jgi:hypothetical protein